MQAGRCWEQHPSIPRSATPRVIALLVQASNHCNKHSMQAAHALFWDLCLPPLAHTQDPPPRPHFLRTSAHPRSRAIREHMFRLPFETAVKKLHTPRTLVISQFIRTENTYRAHSLISITMGKRKATKIEVSDDDDLLLEEEEEEEKPKKKKPTPKKKDKPTDPFDDDMGWHIVPPSLIWKWVHPDSSALASWSQLYMIPAIVRPPSVFL
jgi:hypothetical protein